MAYRSLVLGLILIASMAYADEPMGSDTPQSQASESGIGLSKAQVLEMYESDDREQVSKESAAKSESDQVTEAAQSDSQVSQSSFPSDYFHSSLEGLLDLERILENNGEIEQAFIDLTEEERLALIEAVEKLNEAFREALQTLANESNLP